ncbi:hypothetical protein PoB_007657500 [Plakobranchus ocellatus]|uniref:Uncharacterized protein n=1 Tax=Plakobranchus ocellatus TaxID=259542 RepID=A0AAV4E162_9GAST|nr:hypothetical protein PoB_007657500 [Plakobranchus ocellatus]
MAHPSIHGVGAAFHLRLATDDNIATSSTSPTSPVLSSVQIFFTKHGLVIDFRSKRLLSLDNISIPPYSGRFGISPSKRDFQPAPPIL